VGDPAERQARVLDAAPFELERGGDRNQREGIGQAIADLSTAERTQATAAE
jgi:hypothetical protein